MQESPKQAREPVARLVGRLSNSAHEEEWEIWHNQSLWIGRDAKRCHVVDLDPTVSNWHAKFYSVLFDGGPDIEAVPPLVYLQDFSTNGTFWNDNLIGKTSAPVLLTHGDRVKFGPTTLRFFEWKSAIAPEPIDELQKAERKLFERRYAITTRKLGEGAFGSVHLALDHATKRQLACKIVASRTTRPENDELMTCPDRDYSQIELKKQLAREMREVKILQGLDHPNIIRLEKVFLSDNTMYIFTELMTGGDLFSYLEYKGGSLEYCECGVIVRQILKALEHLHSMQIVHRDVKPDNVFLTSLQNGARVVLGDFGWARKAPRSGKHRKRMHTICGTKEYIAPEMYTDTSGEIQSRGYTKAVDMWALGELTFVLFTGDSSSTLSEQLEYGLNSARIWNLDKVEAVLEERDIDRRPKDFVKKLLVLDEAKRLTATQALNHCWFTHERLRDLWEAAYKRSLSRWKPRPGNQNAIEKLVIPKSTDNNSLYLAYFPPRPPPLVRTVQPRPTILRRPSILPSIAEEVEAAADEELDARLSSQVSSLRTFPPRLPSLQRLDIGNSAPEDPSSGYPGPVRRDSSDVAWASPPEQPQPSYIDPRTLEELSQASTSLLDRPSQLSNPESLTSRSRKRDFSIYSLSEDKDIYDEVAADTMNFRSALDLSQAASKKRKERSVALIKPALVAPVAEMASDPSNPVKRDWDLSSVLKY